MDLGEWNKKKVETKNIEKTKLNPFDETQIVSRLEWKTDVKEQVNICHCMQTVRKQTDLK